MYYMIDNYDSFVYNLSAYIKELGHEIIVRRADHVSLQEIEDLQPEGIIISPGPKRPADAVVSHQILKAFQNRIPILGVCLGHQVIGQFYGALTNKGNRPMHGKVTEIKHDGTGIFAGLPEIYKVTRYHSLVVREENLPDVLRVTARTLDGVVMGIEHRDMPVYGVQFHPEAVLTEYGHEILQNFCDICEEWGEETSADHRKVS